MSLLSLPFEEHESNTEKYNNLVSMFSPLLLKSGVSTHAPSLPPEPYIVPLGIHVQVGPGILGESNPWIHIRPFGNTSKIFALQFRPQSVS